MVHVIAISWNVATGITALLDAMFNIAICGRLQFPQPFQLHLCNLEFKK